MELAVKCDLPVVIHSREAAADTLNILKEFSGWKREFKGSMHCYSYSAEIAKEVIKMGYHIGVGGVITFNNARKLVEALEVIPMDRVLLETDCPYMAPTPHRGERNFSGYLPLVAKKIAELKGITEEEVIRITRENAEAVFGSCGGNA
jgi:TatD DNase family protein